ncbi:hypothetical protein IIA16_02115 [bacterium]|nr:hypothetical protein [bacterium]
MKGFFRQAIEERIDGPFFYLAYELITRWVRFAALQQLYVQPKNGAPTEKGGGDNLHQHLFFWRLGPPTANEAPIQLPALGWKFIPLSGKKNISREDAMFDRVPTGSLLSLQGSWAGWMPALRGVASFVGGTAPGFTGAIS